MMRCSKCGNDLPADSKFCQYCGEDLSKMNFCPFCGFQLQDGMNFCPQCGKNIQVASESADIHQIETAKSEAPKETFFVTSSVVVPASAPAKSLSKAEDIFSEEKTSDEPKVSQPSETEHLTPSKEEGVSVDPQETSFEKIAEEKTMVLSESAESSKIEPMTGTDIPPKQKSKKKWLLIALCAAVAIVAGAWLWSSDTGNPNTQTDPDTDLSKVAESVLYLEIFDENDEVIGSASGFLVNDQNTLVTNYHVVQDAYHIVAKTADGAHSTDVSYILAYDEIADLAVLNCDSNVSTKPLVLGDSESIKQGQAVYAVGYPLGVANTLSDGIVSSRYIDEYNNDIIQVTAAISEGNSGGPLLDTRGQVIGVMCAYYIYGQNLNIAIASNTLVDLIESGYEKTNLKYWNNRPIMPDQVDVEEFPDTEEQGNPAEEVTSPEEVVSPNTSTTPPVDEEAPKPSQSPDTPKTTPTPTSSTYSYFPSVPDFGKLFSVKESFFEEETCSYHYYWTDIGNISTTCDSTYFNALANHGFSLISKTETLYGSVYTYSNGSNNVEYSNYNGRVCISIS